MGLDMDYEAEVFVETENLSREDWLSYRRKGIGGSDAAAIMGMSPFCTKRDLYYDKLGIQAVMDEEEDNWVAKEVGHRLEDLVAEIFSRQTGLKVYPVRKMFRHPLCPFIQFSNKSSGFLVPVRNMDHMIVGAQIRLDHPYDGRKYIWLSSTNFHMGTSSGSPVHLAGSPGEKTIFITEGPLKGDLAHALSGRTFGCVPGANQYANLPPFLQAMKLMGTEAVYEAYDMDKLLRTVCRGDYNEKCAHCESYRKYREGQELPCEKKNVKRQNIQRGCRKLAEICRELELPIKTLTWDTDEDGDWAEHVKGVDDYLHGLEQKKRNS